jgi:hypothetical protein
VTIMRRRVVDDDPVVLHIFFNLVYLCKLSMRREEGTLSLHVVVVVVVVNTKKKKNLVLTSKKQSY